MSGPIPTDGGLISFSHIALVLVMSSLMPSPDSSAPRNLPLHETVFFPSHKWCHPLLGTLGTTFRKPFRTIRLQAEGLWTVSSFQTQFDHKYFIGSIVASSPAIPEYPTPSNYKATLLVTLYASQHQRVCLSICCGKSSNSPPSGLLQPLSVPRRSWTHIALNFVTGHPPS